MECFFSILSESVGEGPYCAKVDVVVEVTPWSRDRYAWEIEELWLVEGPPFKGNRFSQKREEREKDWKAELDFFNFSNEEQQMILTEGEKAAEKAMEGWEPEGAEYEPKP